MSKTKIVGICGSLRSGSVNRAALEAAASLAPDTMTIALWDRLGDIPLYNDDVREKGFPAAVTELAEAIRGADGVLIASPEYNYSIPGVLKNAIDWVTRVENQPFAGKPVALMGASPGAIGTARGQYHLRQCFVFLDGLVMNKPEVMIGGAYDKVKDGKLVHEDTRGFIADKFLPAFSRWIAAHGGAA